jgi:hypothetical protein
MGSAQVSRWRSMCSNDGGRSKQAPPARARRVAWALGVPISTGPGWRWMPGLLGLCLLGGALACSLFRSAVNDSPELRWWLFSRFGADRLCPEMLARSAPLRLTPTGNVIGRLFPTACQHRVDEARRTISLDFTGTGYAWTPLAGRVGFSARAGVEYRADFSLEEDATYVWARPERLLFQPVFQVSSVENRLVDWAQQQGPIAYLTNTFGAQVASGQLSSGFTVVRTESGDAFGLGILQPPQRPPEPLGRGSEERVVVANETTEIRVGQVDFLGPISVVDRDQQVFFQYRLTGPGAEALIFRRYDADRWREQLEAGAALGPPPMQAVAGFALSPGGLREQRLPLPPGQYVILVDHTSQVGAVNPPYSPLNAMGANSLVLSYRLELGETG